MANLFGIQTEASMPECIEIYCDAAGSDDAYRKALNGIILLLHRSGAGTFERLVSTDLGPFLINEDPKVRERAALLCAQVLHRLPELPLTERSVSHFSTFFTSRLADYPSVTSSLNALSALVANHSSLVNQESASTIIRGTLSELPLHRAPQSMRYAALEVVHAILKEPRVHHGLLSMGSEFVSMFCDAVQGEKDPRCLLLMLHLIQLMGSILPESVLMDGSEMLFDLIACYFPITFVPPKNSPYDITSEGLKMALLEAFCCSTTLAPHVIPFLLDKLGSSVKLNKEAALDMVDLAITAYGVSSVAMHLRALAEVLQEEVLLGSDSSLGSKALLSIQKIASTISRYKESRPDLSVNCLEWDNFSQHLLRSSSKDAGSGIETALGKSHIKVLAAVASSCSQAHSEALNLAVPSLLKTASIENENCVDAMDALTLLVGAIPQSEKDLNKPEESYILINAYVNQIYDTYLAVLKSETSHSAYISAIKGIKIILTTYSSNSISESSVVIALNEIAQALLKDINTRPQHIEPDHGDNDEQTLRFVGLDALKSIGWRSSKFEAIIIKDVLLQLNCELNSALKDQNIFRLQLLLSSLCELGHLKNIQLPVVNILLSPIIVSNPEKIELQLESDDLKYYFLSSIFEILKKSENLEIFCKLLLGKSEEDYLSSIIHVALSSNLDQRTLEILMKIVRICVVRISDIANGSKKNFNNAANSVKGSGEDSDKMLCDTSVTDESDAWTNNVKINNIGNRLNRQVTQLATDFLTGKIDSQNLYILLAFLEALPLHAPFFNNHSTLLEELMLYLSNLGKNVTETDKTVEFARCISVLANKLSPGAALENVLNKGFEACKGGILALVWFLRGVILRGAGVGGYRNEALSGLCNLILSAKDLDDNICRDSDLAQELTKTGFGISILVQDIPEYSCLRVSPLWHQRLFLELFPQLQTVTSTSTLLATLHLIQGSPAAVVQGYESKFSVECIIKALSKSNKNLQATAIDALGMFIKDSKLLESLEVHASTLATELIDVISNAPIALTRARALQCLLALTELPYSRLFPVKMAVIKGLQKALDDPKRAVRQTAVKVRNTWLLLGTSM